MCDHCGCSHNPGDKRTELDINQSLFHANEKIARENRFHFDKLGVKVINILSSPGAGKTTLLEKTAEMALKELSFAVIEGDIETDRDAKRLREKGIPALQITTGGACHLDASLIHKAFHELEPTLNERKIPLLFIENVGNLVCPASFFLGEHKRVVMLSVPEGSDKPAKYPRAFISSDLFIISKKDLLPFFDFSVDEASSLAKGLKPDIEILTLSAVSGSGMENWINFLKKLID